MALTREQVKEAFWEAAKMEVADIPPEDKIDYTFSPEYCARRDALIEQVGKMEHIKSPFLRGLMLKKWKRDQDRKMRKLGR